MRYATAQTGTVHIPQPPPYLRILVTSILMEPASAQNVQLNDAGAVKIIASADGYYNLKFPKPLEITPGAPVTVTTSGAASITVTYRLSGVFVQPGDISSSGLVGQWKLNETTGNVGSNLVLNPGFETYTTSPGAPDSWTSSCGGPSSGFTKETTIVRSGLNALAMQGIVGTLNCARQTVTLVGGRSYYFEAWARTNGIGTAQVLMRNETDAANIILKTTAATAYTKLSGTFTAIAGKTYNVYVYNDTATTGINYYDDILIREIVATDSSGQGNDGVLAGAANTSGPTIGAASLNGQTGYSFDGVDDVVTIPDSSNYSFITTMAMTISSWSAAATITESGDIIGKASSPFEWSIRRQSSGAYTFSIWNAAGSNVANDATGVFLDTSIHHIVLTVTFTSTSAGSYVFYVDGIARVSNTFSGVNVISNTASPVTLGQRGDGGGNGFFAGIIDDPRIYNRTLTAAEVLQLYQRGPA